MSGHSVESDRRCDEHDEALIWEPGGDDMPTLYGRWYCPTCQERFMEVLNQFPETPVIPPEVTR